MKSFVNVIKRMEGYWKAFKSQPLLSLTSLNEDFPEEGVYVLYEKGRALYAGRSGRIKRRIAEHVRRCGDHNTSSFAFLLTRQILEKGRKKKKSRQALLEDRRFKDVWISQKKRIAKMKVRAVEIRDHYEQAIFEVYTSMQLATTYNSFKTH